MASRQPKQRGLERKPTCDEDQTRALVACSNARQVEADDIMKGNFLPKLAEENIPCYEKLAPGREVAPARRLKWASACSGSGGDKLVQKAMAAAYRKAGIDIEFETVFDCEIDTSKQQYLRVLQETVDPGVSPCLFKDIGQLGDERAECVVHGGRCCVPGSDILCCCTSCKDVAKPNTRNRSDAQSDASVFTQNTSAGGTAQTWKGFLNYLDRHRPAVFFFENSDTIADNNPAHKKEGKEERSHRQVIYNDISSRGYEAQHMTLYSHSFGVPQCRKRFYMVGVLTHSCEALDWRERSVETVFATFEAFLRCGQRRPPCASSLLLSDSDPYVGNALQRRLSKPPRNVKYDVTKYQKMFAENGLRWGDRQPPKEVKQSPWWQTLTAEQQDSLIYSLAEDKENKLYRDVLWSIGKVRVSKKEPSGHVSFTVMPKQIVMMFPSAGTPRLQLGREAMLLQGFPLPQNLGKAFGEMSENFWHDLAGNMVSLPVCLNILMSIVAAVDWRKTPTVCPCAEEIKLAEESSQFIRSAMARLDAEHAEHGEHGEHERRPVKKCRHR